MYKKIFLATDGSEYSGGAIRESIRMASSCESLLFAMSVVEVNQEFLALAPSVVEKMETETRGHLDSIRERAAQENVECETIIREGEEPYRYIVEEADRKHADVIVMGRRGRKGIKRLLMGSVTAKVIGLGPFRVLVVPRAAEITWKSIVIATDGSEYSKAAVQEALKLAEHCGEKVSLHAIAVTRRTATDERLQISMDALKEIRSKAEQANIQVDDLLVKSIPHETIYEAILKYAKDKNADFIVMGSRGRTGLQRLIMGSVTERVIGFAPTAVLVVKP